MDRVIDGLIYSFMNTSILRFETDIQRSGVSVDRLMDSGTSFQLPMVIFTASVSGQKCTRI